MNEARRFFPLLLAVGCVVLVLQGVDLLAVLAGSDLGVPGGRVRQLLAVESRSPGALTADLLVIWSLLGQGKWGALRVLGALHWVLGALLLLAVPLFLSDAGSMATGFAGAPLSAFRVVVVRTLGMLGLLSLLAILVGRALRLAARESESVS